MSLSFRPASAKPADSVPGPGEYNSVIFAIDGERARKMPKEERFLRSKLFEKDQKLQPGPGDFDPSYEHVLAKAPVIS